VPQAVDIVVRVENLPQFAEFVKRVQYVAESACAKRGAPCESCWRFVTDALDKLLRTDSAG